MIKDLEVREARGAAEAVWRSAATFEPRDRALRTEDEMRRVLLLADRALRHWVPSTIKLLDRVDVSDLAGQLPRIQETTQAQLAENQLGTIRQAIRRETGSIRRVSVSGDEVATALAPFQSALRQIEESSTLDLEDLKVSAISNIAEGLVRCFYLGTPPGIPEEVANTVHILDVLDPEARRDIPVSENVRISNEGEVHSALVSALGSHLALNFYPVTHGDGFGALPQPPKVKRHRPDLIAEGSDGSRIIGEAKTGPDLFTQHSQQQIADFLSFASENSGVAFWLMVPAGWRSEAERAVTDSGGDPSQMNIIEADGIIGSAPSP